MSDQQRAEVGEHGYNQQHVAGDTDVTSTKYFRITTGGKLTQGSDCTDVTGITRNWAVSTSLSVRTLQERHRH